MAREMDEEGGINEQDVSGAKAMAQDMKEKIEDRDKTKSGGGSGSSSSSGGGGGDVVKGMHPVKQMNDRVKAQCQGWKSAYWGVVYAVNENGTYGVTFEDGEQVAHVRNEQIQWDAKEDIFSIGTKVRAKFAGKGHYYPATIEKVNEDGTFDLKYMDGDWEEGATKNNLQMVPS
jgi:hypothetical protein